MILDFHTHRLQAGDALISISPSEFNPQPGLLYSVGIHPWNTLECTDRDFQLLEEVATHPQVVAIGETGMDSLHGASLDVQHQIFCQHVALAERVGKPLVIHMVRTSQQVLKVWQNSHKSVAWVIHGFRGNERVAQPLIDAGFYLSYGPQFNPTALKITPHDRLLIETDSDLTTTIHQVAEKVAQTLGITPAELESLASHNATKAVPLTP